MLSLAVLANRRTLFGSIRERLFRASVLASTAFVVLFVIALLIAPLARREMVRVELPEPARILLPEPQAPAREAAREQMAVRPVVDPIPLRLPDHMSLPTPKLRHDDAQPETDASRAGRERAQQVTAELASTAGAIDRAIRDLSSALRDPAGGDYRPARTSRQRDVRAGRGDGQLPGVPSGAASAGGQADLKGSTVAGTMVAIGALAQPAADDSRPASDVSRGGGAAPGVFRSNASLLAVIRKYAAGIQYCYDSELRRDPGLKGKLVVALTVAASGAVTECRVVQNTLGSERLAACALSQIRDWKFPPIAEGVTTFQAPFVFTPPN
jgi:TonB family protein